MSTSADHVCAKLLDGPFDFSGAPAARDFHQSPERFQWLRENRIETRLAVASQHGRVASTAIIERHGDRWYMWKGPTGHPARGDVLGAMVSACAPLFPITLVLQPEWAQPDVLSQAGYAHTCPFQTLLVRTDGSESDVLARMKPATRSRVARGLRAGLQFIEDRSGIERFYPLYAASMRSSGSPDFATFDEQASMLRLPAVRLFLALLGNDVAAGSVCFENEDSLEARYVATNARHRHLGPLNVVHFNAIQRAANAGKQYLDLSGIANGDVDEKLMRINRFKEGFGGITREFPTFTRDRDAAAAGRRLSDSA